MASSYLFTSDRLGFRHWQDRDIDPFVQLNQDPEVMAFFSRVWTKEDSTGFMERMKAHFQAHGFGLYAVDTLKNNAFIGLIGFKIPGIKTHFTPCIEMVWRLKKEVWNQGYATEGAKRCLAYGFEDLDFAEVLAYCPVVNQASERIMQKIGMEKIEEYDHPTIEAERLKRFALYRSQQESF